MKSIVGQLADLIFHLWGIVLCLWLAYALVYDWSALPSWVWFAPVAVAYAAGILAGTWRDELM